MRYQLIFVALFLALAACAQEPAHVDRATIEAVFETVQRMTNSGDNTGFEQLFAEDGTFVNSALPEPVRGREAIRDLGQWAPAEHRPEWVVIDGNRLAFGWTERQSITNAASRLKAHDIASFMFVSRNTMDLQIDQSL